MDEWKETIRELYMGIGICTLTFTAAGGLLVRDRSAWILGTILGGGEAAFLAWHMARGIVRSMEMEPRKAARGLRLGAMLRMLMMGLSVLIAVLLPGTVSAPGVLAGIFSLKLGALIQPLVHRCRKKLRKER